MKKGIGREGGIWQLKTLCVRLSFVGGKMVLVRGVAGGANAGERRRANHEAVHCVREMLRHACARTHTCGCVRTEYQRDGSRV
jgi:hypothetical protein